MNNFNAFLNVTGTRIDRNNLLFAYFLTIFMGILGSISSVMIAVAFGFVLLLQMRGLIRTQVNRDVWLVASFFIFFFASGTFQALIHFDGGDNLKVIIKRLPFLAIVPLVAVLFYSKQEAVKTNLETGAAVGAFLAMIYTIFEISSGALRTEVMSGNPGPFATSLSLALTLCLFGLLRSKTRHRVILMSIGIAGATICVVTSGVRTLWPLLVVLPVIAIWGRGKYNTLKLGKNYLLGGMILAVILYFLIGDLFFLRFKLLYLSILQIADNGQYQSSLGTRLVMWEYASGIISESLWVGVGQTQAVDGVREFLVSNYNNHTQYSHFHNFVINALISGGVIELAAILGLLIGPIVVVWKYRNIENCRYGVAFMLATSTIIATSGMLNIGFGHDIHDSLFTYFMAVSTWIVLGNNEDEIEPSAQ